MIGEEDILVEIEGVISNGAVPAAQAAREYYSAGELPALMERYFRQRGLPKRSQQAKALGVSPQTLNRILAGDDISENMLFRFRNSIHRAMLLKHYSVEQVESLLSFPWRQQPDMTESRALRELVKSLEIILLGLQKSNSIGENGVLSVDQKAQLISMLKELLAKLEAPLVNIEETDRAVNRVGAVLRKGVDKALEEEAKKAATGLVGLAREYLVGLIKDAGLPSLRDFFS